MEQYKSIENDFWSRWSALTSKSGEKHDVHKIKIPVHSKSMELTIAIDACWLSLMDEVFSYWENTTQEKNKQGNSLSENSIVRRKLIDAWIELELAKSVHEEAMITTGSGQSEKVRLARSWVVRCLKFFVVEMPPYVGDTEVPWQAQAQLFLNEFFKPGSSHE